MHISEITFDGLAALELVTPQAKMVLITGTGPRIAFWGQLDGDNLLYWDKAAIERNEWKLMGGHRVWITRPLADEAEDTYRPDNDPCEVVTTGDSVQATSPVDPVMGIRRGIRVRALSDDTFEVVSLLENGGPMIYSGGVWAPTCIADPGSKEFGILLGDRAESWDLITLVIPRAWGGHTSLINDPQIMFTEDFLVVKPARIEMKRAVMAPHGMVVMTSHQLNLSFVKQAPYLPLAQYPLMCNLAVYNGPDNLLFEMETYGPQQTILPGHIIEHVETWKLISQVIDWNDPDSLLAQ
jgi:hypothetical protein